MPEFEWCRTCPGCEERVSDIIHLYVDDSASDDLHETFVLALFQTRYVGYWGKQNIQWRINSGRATAGGASQDRAGAVGALHYRHDPGHLQPRYAGDAAAGRSRA